jgi:type I restriction enzyme, S subunit
LRSQRHQTLMTSIFLDHFDDLLATPEDVEQLNRAILQLAVQGKLVLQDLQDEPAEILYNRILKEKKQNLNGRTPRSLPSVSHDEIPFEIPSTWVWTRLGEISSYGEATKSKSVEFTDETWVLDLEDIEKTTSRLIQRVRLKDRHFQSEKSVFQKGDVIYGKLRPYLDKVIVADEDGICSSELIPIKTYGNINPFYLRLALKRPDFIDYVNGKTYGVKMPRLGTQDARMALVPLPPLAEQLRIVARVEELFAQTRALATELAHSQIELDGLNKSALSHLLASETPEEFNQHWEFIAEHFDLLFQTPEHVAPLRQSILELAVRGKLTRREAGDEYAGELLDRLQSNGVANNIEKKNSKNIDLDLDNLPSIPENWLWCRVGDICDCIVPNRDKPESFSGDIPWITLPDFNGSMYISESKSGLGLTQEEAILYNARIVPANSVVMSCIGRFGIIGILTKNAVVNQQLHAFLIEDGLNAEYLAYALKTQVPYMDQLATSTTIKYLNKSNCNSVPIPLPPTAEQERIVKRVEQLLSLCDALETRLQSAEEERGRLVAAVMAGVGG